MIEFGVVNKDVIENNLNFITNLILNSFYSYAWISSLKMPYNLDWDEKLITLQCLILWKNISFKNKYQYFVTRGSRY